jgi:hypothetical protein
MPRTAYPEYCIIPTLAIASSQLVSCRWADHGLLNSVYSHSHKFTQEHSFSYHYTSLPNYHLQIECSKYCFIFNRSWSPSASPHLLNHELQAHLYTHYITASRCISKLPCWWSSSAFPFSLNHHHQVYLETRSIMALKCITTLAWVQTQSACQTWLNHDRGVHLNVKLITDSTCISKYPWLQPASPSPNHRNDGVRIHHHVHSIIMLGNGCAWRATAHD